MEPRDPASASFSDTLVSPGSDDAARTTPPAAGPPPEPRADHVELPVVDPAHYVVTTEIARGGMGRISVARDLRLGRDVALKEALDDGGDLARRFEREVRITARLQHPSIVSVHEAGRWPTGAPFYAMKLVSGRSLDTIIDATPTLAGRLASLPAVLAVADAIAYAHRERVIHRDLKPHNVIVGEFGETVVIDWGLAKQLDVPDLTTSGARPRELGQTSAGEILGTLGYMPPEQAIGEPVDERADVYAIGAILYHLLAGRPPFSGATFGDVFVKVRDGTPAPIASIEPDAPADLIAIAGRAMARDRAARYPTARELADDLRRFQTGQLVGAHRYSLRELLVRWARRHGPVLSVLAVALVVIAAGGVLAVRSIMAERAAVIAQGAVAQRNQADAEQLMQFMLHDLRPRLLDLGRLDVLETAARRAATYYDEHHGSGSDGDHVAEATSRLQIAEVLVTKGVRAMAQAELGKAQALAASVAPTSPAHFGAQQVLAAVALLTGRDLLARGDSTAALAAFRDAERQAAQLVAARPTDRGARISRARAAADIAGVLDTQGDRAAARAADRESLAVLGAIPEASPELALITIIVRAHLGRLASLERDFDGALVEYRAAQAIGAREAAANPSSVVWAWHLANSHDEVGKMLRAKHDDDGALAEFRAALAISERLATIEPANARWQHTLAVAHESIADVLTRRRELAAAMTELRAAHAVDAALVDHDPTNRSLRRDLSVLQNKLGDLQAEAGELAAAIASYRAGVAIRAELVRADPANAEWQRDLWYSHYRLAGLLERAHDAPAALDELRQAQAIAEPLAARAPDDETVQHDLVHTHAARAGRLTSAHDLAGTRAELERALAIARRMAARPRATPRWPELVTELEHELATCCGKPG